MRLKISLWLVDRASSLRISGLWLVHCAHHWAGGDWLINFTNWTSRTWKRFIAIFPWKISTDCLDTRTWNSKVHACFVETETRKIWLPFKGFFTKVFIIYFFVIMNLFKKLVLVLGFNVTFHFLLILPSRHFSDIHTNCINMFLVLLEKARQVPVFFL